MRFVCWRWGELGARELNFSSDVDLVVLFSGVGETHGPTPIAHQLWATKAVQFVAKWLEEMTPHGRLFRVDLGLRPFGNAGPLATPVEAAVSYYLNTARAWERMALLRARPCGGDTRVFDAFWGQVQPNLYPSRPPKNLGRQIVDIKNDITRESETKMSPGFNVKLGTGGIREIEFFAQTLQMMHGGKHPALRQTKTTRLLEALFQCDLIERTVYESLRDDYLFLRRVRAPPSDAR